MTVAFLVGQTVYYHPSEGEVVVNDGRVLAALVAATHGHEPRANLCVFDRNGRPVAVPGVRVYGPGEKLPGPGVSYATTFLSEPPPAPAAEPGGRTVRPPEEFSDEEGGQVRAGDGEEGTGPAEGQEQGQEEVTARRVPKRQRA